MNTAMENITVDFARNAEQYWSHIARADSKSANAVNRENEKLVAALVKQGKAKLVLSPLLHNSSSKVRLAAAAALIKSDGLEEARTVLVELAEDPAELIKQSARAVLRCYAK
ncbi:hypothetical protein [Azospira sp. I09]|uniref:hypothetical protein n=1 Tax=Azospira sp. I09 TaxID=1765049 RepID=UPI0012606A19|nr:hypothetical protein [Azospira sp. I09]BBN90672.1 hypothetical protein AZSP09_36950 [Azospira sp. I09]